VPHINIILKNFVLEVIIYLNLIFKIFII